MTKHFILAVCLTALLAGCATPGGGDNPGPDPFPPQFPDCRLNPWDPWCRPPLPPIPPLPPRPPQNPR